MLQFKTVEVKLLKFMKFSLILFVIMLFSNSCEKIFSHGELSLSKTPYIGNELRIDGYYYTVSANSDYLYYHEYFFYKDGMLLVLSGITNSYAEMDDYILTFYINCDDYKDYLKSWGLFHINDGNIKIEHRAPGRPLSKTTYIKEGVILNDTTFLITKIYSMRKGKKGEIKERNETYHFRQFSPKPDSTNNFIK